jgi:hypothetical protein
MIKVLDYKITKVENNKKEVIVYTPSKTYSLTCDSLWFLHESIYDTYTAYIFPTVFIKFYKLNVSTNAKIIYSESDLFNLRVWANVYRDTYTKTPFNTNMYNLALKIMDLSSISVN